MSLIRLELTAFRNLQQVKLNSLSSGFNFFYGQNGSGKTSVLEAIYYLSHGRSFRCSLNHRLIQNDADKFAVFAEYITAADYVLTLGAERQRNGEVRLRMDSQTGSVAAMAQSLPVLLINSHCFRLIEEGPGVRRKYLDWGAFYLLPDFLGVWKSYQRALKQRNSALKKSLSNQEIAIWTTELAQKGQELDQLRGQFTEKLLPYIQQMLTNLINIADLKLIYQPGWDKSRLSYYDALTANLAKDRQAGFTQLGPHRADLKIIIGRTPVQDLLSRGQQKLFVCAMILAQGALLNECINRRPIYLIDDLPSELDQSSKAKLMSLLHEQKMQAFLTAIEPGTLADPAFSKIPSQMFHVEHGVVKEC
jgi:DNA replication and repair protein RecF